jgi:hypothetical protein
VYVRDLSTWQDFEAQLHELRGNRSLRKAGVATHVSDLLFRGHRDHAWKLETTLERQAKGNLSLRQYYRLISAARPQIQTVLGSTWNVPEYPDYQKWLEASDTFMPGDFPGYDYMVYLRHHGFPSPLLDWTRSPYVAAYFAFAGATATDQQVSVYVYLEYAGGGKARSTGKAHIHGMGPYVSTHRRHFLQQSEYTICLRRDEEWRYASHEEAFARNDDAQDLLWKLNLPSSERLNVLKHLDAHNINAFSLFGTEDALMHTVALRELHFRDRDL